MTARLPAEVASQAGSNGLGGYVGSLKPDRSASLRTLGIGAALIVAAVTIPLSSDVGWLVRGAAVLGGLAGGVMAPLGLIELLPGPGQLYLFENGFVHQLRGGPADARRYDASERGEELRQRAASMRNHRGG